MSRVSWILLATFALAACDGGKSETTTPTAEPTPTAAAEASASAAPEASTAEPEASASAEPEATAEATAQASGAPVHTAKTAPTASAAIGAKKYDCGGKGQKACPMQGWMKGVMARAMASGDKDKIAQALETIASKPVAGMGQWSGIAAAGAAAARSGDIDGAKASCKKCHDMYQKTYQDKMRDQPW